MTNESERGHLQDTVPIRPPRREEKTQVAMVAITPVSVKSKAPFLVPLSGARSGLLFPIPRTGEVIIGRDPGADFTIKETECSRRHARIFHDAAGDLFLEDLGSTNGTFANGGRLSGPYRLMDGDRIDLGATIHLKFAYQDTVEENFQISLYESATRDPLTGAYNKRYFLESLEREIRLHQRQSLPLSLIMLDMDHFKAINDEHGHVAGDQVLKSVAATISGRIRKENLFCRFGGEEFALILSNTSLEDARKLAERLRESVQALDIPWQRSVIKITVSLGLAALKAGGEASEDFIGRADEELYRAKKQGRNRVCAPGPD